MVKVDVLRKRMAKLDEYIDILRSLQTYSLETFLSNPIYYGSAERFLQLAIEAINDMGSHIIVDLGLGSVDWYSDVPDIFLQHEYIDETVAERWRKMTGFRNVLVHDYLDINREIVYDALQHNLEDFEAIKECLKTFIE
jgi:uncharacterized protein YutE (UPF0331/DUF86 family)